jgi:hypothetical protein
MVRPFPWLFPYTEDVVSRTSEVTGRTILHPVVQVTMAADEEQLVYALVDSGSEHTLSGMGHARLIGADPDPVREMRIGVGGAWRTARFADIRLRLAPPDGAPDDVVEWTATVGFFTQWGPPWALLLGQVGFFDQFTVTMNRLSQALAIEPATEFDARYGIHMEPNDR